MAQKAVRAARSEPVAFKDDCSRHKESTERERDPQLHSGGVKAQCKPQKADGNPLDIDLTHPQEDQEQRKKRGGRDKGGQQMSAGTFRSPLDGCGPNVVDDDRDHRDHHTDRVEPQEVRPQDFRRRHLCTVSRPGAAARKITGVPYGRRATPRIWGAEGNSSAQGWNMNSRHRWMTKPARSIAERVSRLV